MRAAVLRRPGTPLTIEDVDLDDPGPGEVAVRVLAAGVCHSDLHYMNGDLQGRLPAVLGHEGAGVVERVGAGVTRVQPGDTVITLWRPRCGECEFCLTGRPALCPLGKVQATSGGLPDGTSRLALNGEKVHHLMGVSCFAEKCVVSERSVVAVDPAVPPAVAAITGCAVVTGVGAALNVMEDVAGSGVVVIGAGGVGLSAVMGLRLVGANPIVAVDTVDTKLDKALELGATHTINASTHDVAEELARISPRPMSWALDAVGAPQTLQQAFEVVGTGGTVVAVGLGKVGATVPVPINPLVQQEKRLIGSLYGSANTPVDIPKLIDLFKAGRLPLDKLLGEQYELSEINEAYAALSRGATGRAVILPGGEG
ncbi:alcohol dehydrogenase catalytic domain-containing protein [Saccharopolyspora sp. WRP15-2]|uniref:Alcohol dehydrogenase catalytic domain-containing protein n=1 Tax=Saccharopolyspora oryzae TaxID=2997343 RepID=A0ABT4VAA7_9PSEU|nr:zinc-binding dehydrogenase [Saccharopolyspora oryzae]MDA3630889.1 alcohol dehydrogenase catalytic domain-containing protein [Saccharopolyspora oryzae]